MISLMSRCLEVGSVYLQEKEADKYVLQRAIGKSYSEEVCGMCQCLCMCSGCMECLVDEQRIFESAESWRSKRNRKVRE